MGDGALFAGKSQLLFGGGQRAHHDARSGRLERKVESLFFNEHRVRFRAEPLGGEGGTRGRQEAVAIRMEGIVLRFFRECPIAIKWRRHAEETARELASIKDVLGFLTNWPEPCYNHKTNYVVAETLRLLGSEMKPEERGGVIEILAALEHAAVRFGWDWCAVNARWNIEALKAEEQGDAIAKKPAAEWLEGVELPESQREPVDYAADNEARLATKLVMKKFWEKSGISFRWIGHAERAAEKIAALDGALGSLLDNECEIMRWHHRAMYIAIRAVGALAEKEENGLRQKAVEWIKARRERALWKGWTACVYAADQELAKLEGRLSEKDREKLSEIAELASKVRAQDYEALEGLGLKRGDFERLILACEGGDAEQRKRDAEQVTSAIFKLELGKDTAKAALDVLQKLFVIMRDREADPELQKIFYDHSVMMGITFENILQP